MKRYPNLEGEMRPLDLHDPAPGVYVGVPMDVYLEISATSRSSIKTFRECREEYGMPKKDKSYTIFGTQYHTFVLEPHLFESTYFEYDGNRDMRHAAYAETVRTAGSQDRIYKPKEKNQMKEMLDVLQSIYPKSYKWLTGKYVDNGKVKSVKKPPLHELTVVALCPITGLKLKIRIDTAWIDLGVMVDLKSTNNALLGPFKYNAKKFGNDLQPGFYCYVCSLIPELESINNFYFIAQTTEKPYIVRRYPVREYSIDTDGEVNPIPRMIGETKSILTDFKIWLDEGRPISDEPIFISFQRGAIP